MYITMREVKNGKNEGAKLPTKIKILRGTDRADRIKEDELEFTPLGDLPTPPEWMGDLAKIEFNAILEEYFNLGILSKLDLPTLHVYCQAYDDYVRFTKYVRGNETQTNDSGLESNIPQVMLRQKAMDTMLKYATQFGLTVKARSNISNGRKKEDVDSFEAQFGKTG